MGGLAAQALEGYQALYVHIKGPDIPAHDGRAEDKRDVIEAIDRAFFGEVLPRLDLGRDARGRARRPRDVLRPQGAHGRSGAARARRRRLHVRRSASYGEGVCAEGSLGQLLGPEIVPCWSG